MTLKLSLTVRGDGSARECVFCSRADRQMTREHVFARWLVQKIHGGRLVASGPASGPAGPIRIARVLASVCADCNAGWMSGLEVSFRRILFAAPRVGGLPTPDRVALSRWFAKTAVLLSHARGTEFLSAEQRSEVIAGVPDDIEVFLARRRRPRQALDFGLDVTTGPTGDAARVRSVAILVDDVFAHVAERGRLTSAHGARLWPLRSHILRWDTLPVITRPLSA